MNGSDPIALLFADMYKLGPGSDADTLHVLQLLPKREFQVVVDAGCGAGRQTLALAKKLLIPIQAVDSHQPFLDRLEQRAGESGVGHLIQTHLLDMKDIPRVFPAIDLLWGEGAAYNIGFSFALKTWAKAIKPNGFAVINELCWLRDRVPGAMREFFSAGYPEMKTVEQNIAIIEKAGYKVRDTHTLARETWIKDYYDILEPRAHSLLHHADVAVQELAAATISEIETFSQSEGSYGYVFFVLEPISKQPGGSMKGFGLPFF